MQFSAYEQRTDAVSIRRGSLVKPHVHAASLFMSLVLELFGRVARLREPAANGLAIPPPDGRTHEPVFLEECLCEHVIDSDLEHEHWVCLGRPKTAASGGVELACRQAVKNGRFVYYCNKLE